MTKTTFKSTVKASGGTTTGIPVPAEALAALGPSKKPAVKVTFSGYAYRTTIGTMDGVAMLPLSAAHRQAAGVKAGDTLTVTLELDAEPRAVEVPEDLAAALAKKSGARARFDALAPSKRKEYVRQVTEAKAAETRARRIAKIVADVST